MEFTVAAGAGLRANAAPVKARYQRFELKLTTGQLDESERESVERAMEQARPSTSTGTSTSGSTSSRSSGTTTTTTTTTTSSASATPSTHQHHHARGMTQALAELEMLQRAESLEPQQGAADPAAAMYSEGMAHARARLRSDSVVTEELDRWWNVAVGSLEAAGGAAGEAVLEKADYVAISRLLFKALMPIWDAAAAQRSAEEDWSAEAGGSQNYIERRSFLASLTLILTPTLTLTLTRTPTPTPAPTPALAFTLTLALALTRSFLDSLFQLADVWAEGPTPNEYANFLAGLFGAVTLPVTLLATGQCRLWRAEGAIAYGVEASGPQLAAEAAEVVEEAAAKAAAKASAKAAQAKARAKKMAAAKVSGPSHYSLRTTHYYSLRTHYYSLRTSYYYSRRRHRARLASSAAWWGGAPGGTVTRSVETPRGTRCRSQ